jgi:hypothetical protein
MRLAARERGELGQRFADKAQTLPGRADLISHCAAARDAG